MVGNRSTHKEKTSRHLKALKYVREEEMSHDDVSSWQLNSAKKDLDSSPSKSSRTSALSYSSTLINPTESLSSSSSSDSARIKQSQSHKIHFDLAQSSSCKASPTQITRRQKGSRNSPGYARRNELDTSSSIYDYRDTERISPSSAAAHGLSPVSLTDDYILSWSDSNLQHPYESIIDTKSSHLSNSTEDDNDTIQIMMNSTTQFQLGGQHHRRPKASSDSTLFPTMFQSKNNPFVERYTPVPLSNVGQSVSRFQEPSTSADHHYSQRTLRRNPSTENTSEYILKSLTPDRKYQLSNSDTPSNKTFASIFWVSVSL